MQWIRGGKDQKTNGKDFGWETRKVVIEDYAYLRNDKGHEIESDEFKCFGRRWRVCVFPGGDNGATDGMASIYIELASGAEITLKYSLCVRDSNEKIMVKYAEASNCFNDGYDDVSGAHNFCKKETLLNYLVDGGLVIEVRMKQYKPLEEDKPVFVPKNPLCNIIQNMFKDESSADCVIEVVRELPTSPCKKAKIEPFKFPVHQLILKQCAPMLAELCSSSKPGLDGIHSVQISDVKPDVLHSLLQYVYGGKVSYNSSNIKDIIDAADRYGIVHLKLEAESEYVKSTTISLENVMDNLLYADAKNLALLKEVVMDYIVENKLAVMEEVSFKDCPGTPTLMKDVLGAVARETKDGADNNDNRYSIMRISELRKELYEKGLDIDGSRETLIAALKKEKEDFEKDIKLGFDRLTNQMLAQMEGEDDDGSGDDSETSSDSDV